MEHSPRTYTLEITRGIERGRRYDLGGGAAGIGRGTQSAITLHTRDKAVSEHHAILYVNENSLTLQDLDSTNGTFVNGERISEARKLTPGDEIGLGRTGPRLRVCDNSASEQLAAAQPASPYPAAALQPRVHSGTSTDTPLTQPSSPTAEFGRRIVEGALGATGILCLLRNPARLGRVLDSDTIDPAHRNMLAAAFNAHHRARARWFYIGATITVALVILLAFSIYRAQNLKAQLSVARALKNELDSLETAFAGADSAERDHLLATLTTRASALDSVRSALPSETFESIYTDPIERALDRIMQSLGETSYHLPPEMVERVRYHIDIYAGRMKPTITRYFERKKTYFPMYYEVLSQRNLPAQLAYVSMLESGLSPQALSHAGARGLWQFMPATARAYRLQVDSLVDERTDPKLSTVAAAEYIRDLIGMFGAARSVMLAMAAYNAGEGRLLGALKRLENPFEERDFWHLYRMKYLPEETREYIPRILALIIIDTEREQYGFEPEQ